MTPTPAPMPDQDLVLSLRRKIDEIVHPLVPLDRPVAVLDFPVYSNVGDSAIWLGVIECLRRRGVKRLDYVCSFRTYSRENLARRLGDGTILLSGGGNFGDRYEPHQRLREDVIASFPNNPIVQLPQSIWYESTEAIEKTRKILGAHRHLTMLLRDQHSLDFARTGLGVAGTLCPDMAISLAPLKPVGPPGDRIVWLSRTDKESIWKGRVHSPEGVHRVDWVRHGEPSGDSFDGYISQRLRARALRMKPFYGPVARWRLRRGIAMLNGAGWVITDRLHGHIICTMLGLRHFVLNNSNGKVRAFYDSWTRTSSLARWCETEAEALELALEERRGVVAR
jgi:pyruvyl transferase EpsO